MKCERCGEAASVEHYEVDGYTGYLCADCVDAWDRIQSQ